MAKSMYEDGYKFYLSENNVWLVDNVPVKYIELKNLKIKQEMLDLKKSCYLPGN